MMDGFCTGDMLAVGRGGEGEYTESYGSAGKILI
jgi:hypothetical protein